MAVKKFSTLINELKELSIRFDPNTTSKKIKILASCLKVRHNTPQDLIWFQDLLLFMSAHAESKEIIQAIEKAKKKVAAVMQDLPAIKREDFRDSFLPFTETSLIFSRTFLDWLNHEEDCELIYDGNEAEEQMLNAVLKLSLPTLETEITTIGYNNEELLRTLKVKKNQELQFLLGEFNRMEASEKVKDFIWDNLKIWTRIKGTKPSFSKLFNQFQYGTYFFQSDILKRFDPNEVFQKPLPKPTLLTEIQKHELRKVIGKSMVHTMRETDPATYMNVSTLTYYELERGISIAHYGLLPERQLPLQTYVGYTLFKNGFPLAYGGAWVFGERAHFGINIYEPYRGGESGYVLCTLLRSYIQAFGVKHIEIDGYQFGRDNMDGIKSGAFWFYYKFGFRPIDKSLKTLSTKEDKKIKSGNGYRSAEKTLIQLSESDMALQLSVPRHPSVSVFSARVQESITKKFVGNRNDAIAFVWTKYPKLYALTKKDKQLAPAALELGMLALFGLKKKAVSEELLSELCLLRDKDYVAYNRQLAICINA